MGSYAQDIHQATLKPAGMQPWCSVSKTLITLRMTMAKGRRVFNMSGCAACVMLVYEKGFVHHKALSGNIGNHRESFLAKVE